MSRAEWPKLATHCRERQEPPGPTDMLGQPGSTSLPVHLRRFFPNKKAPVLTGASSHDDKATILPQVGAAGDEA